MDNYNGLLSLSDEVQSLICSSPNKPIAEMNIIELFDPNEPQTSCLLEMLFSYKDSNGDLPLFRSFAHKFLEPIGFDLNHIKYPEIHREEKHIDLWIVESGKYAIIFENKLKGADFQRNQLARYIQTIRNLGYSDKQIYIVLLPKDTRFELDWIRDSVWKCPSDALSTTNGNRRCGWKDSVSCWCDYKEMIILNKNDLRYCEKCEQSLKQDFSLRTIILKSDFSAWMIGMEREINSRERNVRSAILQFADYLDSLYNNRLNIMMKNEIDEFIIEKLNPSKDENGWIGLGDKLRELAELQQSIERVKYKISTCLIDKWYANLKDKWPGMIYEPHKSFGYVIDNKIWVGCKFYYEDENNLDMGSEGQPFWGFIRTDDKIASQAQIKLIRRILAQSDGAFDNGNWNDSNYIVWGDTLAGDICCDILFTAIKDLKLL